MWKRVLSFIFRWVLAPLNSTIHATLARDLGFLVSWVTIDRLNESRVFDAARRLTAGGSSVHPPFHEVGFGSMWDFSEFFDRGIIRTTLATCWWLRHRFGIVRPSLRGTIPRWGRFLRGNCPGSVEIGYPPTWASRFRSSEVRMNSEVRGEFFT